MSTQQEEFWVLALNPSKDLIEMRMLFRGTVDACLVHPRDVFRFLCEVNATSFVVAHNHPSDAVTASAQDWNFTRRLAACAEIFEIALLDHIIVGQTAAASLAAERPWLFTGLNLASAQGSAAVEPRKHPAAPPKSH